MVIQLFTHSKSSKKRFVVFGIVVIDICGAACLMQQKDS
jgi:hypothetical protein